MICFARYVGRFLGKTDITNKRNAPLVGVKSIEIMPQREDVYNMEVAGVHNFAVNGGIVVHNCMDCIRYFVQTKEIFIEKDRRR